MIYRWGRRKNNTYNRRIKPQFEPLDYVLVIAIFLTWFLTLRVIFIFQTVTTPCIEAWLTTGQSPDTMSLFSVLKSISYSLLIFWGCLSITRWIARKSEPISYVWQTLTGLPILLLVFAHYMMTPSLALNPPDGVMRVHSNIVANINGTDHFIPRLEAHDVFGQWEQNTQLNTVQANEYACIWLHENKVSMRYKHRDNIFGAMSWAERFNTQRQNGVNLYKPSDWAHHQNIAFKKLIQNRFKSVDLILAEQAYRPLTELERERFITTQSCMQDLSNYGKHRSYCEYEWSVDWESYYHISNTTYDAEYAKRLKANPEFQ